MNRLKAAELTSGIGAVVLGVGLGALFPGWLAPSAGWITIARAAMALGCWMAITFTICVVGGVIVPALPIPHRTLELLLPGFVWISAQSFALGLVESFAYGVYAAGLFVALYNVFERRAHRARPGTSLKAA